jgi:hypothetical protein
MMKVETMSPKLCVQYISSCRGGIPNHCHDNLKPSVLVDLDTVKLFDTWFRAHFLHPCHRHLYLYVFYRLYFFDFGNTVCYSYDSSYRNHITGILIFINCYISFISKALLFIYIFVLFSYHIHKWMSLYITSVLIWISLYITSVLMNVFISLRYL